jgi:hypothetical protein
MEPQHVVTPAEAGVQSFLEFLDSGRRDAGQMASFVLFLGSEIQGLFDLAVLQHVGKLGSDLF